jgi:Zn-dependent peptidase ImmA (M78 family)
MRAEQIKREVARLKAKYQTMDLRAICAALKIRISQSPMGTSADSCKGFFLVNARCKLIMLNSDLADEIQDIILAHELGHAILHSSPAIRTFHEFTVLDETDRMEYEANVFAAEFLVEDQEALDTFGDQMTLFQASSILGVPPELLDFKVRLLEKEGYPIHAPYIAHGDFLKRDISKPLN